jgi:hypothetical protein
MSIMSVVPDGQGMNMLNAPSLQSLGEGEVTAFDLHLDRRVRDVEAMFDVMHDGAQHLLAVSDALLGQNTRPCRSPE